MVDVTLTPLFKTAYVHIAGGYDFSKLTEEKHIVAICLDCGLAFTNLKDAKEHAQYNPVFRVVRPKKKK